MPTTRQGECKPALRKLWLGLWGWTSNDWREALRSNGGFPTRRQYVQYAIVVGYLLCGHHDLHVGFRSIKRPALAAKIFGAAPFQAAVERAQAEIRQWGYSTWLTDRDLPNTVATLLLRCGSSRLEDITAEAIAAALSEEGLLWHVSRGVGVVARALVKLGMLPAGALPPAAVVTLSTGGREPMALRAPPDVPAAWAQWCERWYATSTISAKARRIMGYYLLRAGRWLAAHHPEVTEPAQWTRELAAAYVAAVDHLKVGEIARASAVPATVRLGAVLSPPTKDKHLEALRVFFRDGQEWGWFTCRFDPRRAFATPPSVKVLIGPKPRVIADAVWAKLLWAGLNLTSEDLPALYRGKSAPYPPTMVRALIVAWLFTGLRWNELRRLRVGCVRWQRDEASVAGTAQVLPQDSVCWLDVPVNKTSTSFTKAVDRVVGEAITAWEQSRPTQLPAIDAKTQEMVQFLFAYRGRQMGERYLNTRLIPVLCRKAGVPPQDARGRITSHRARSTIATQLANAKEPMSLLELMEWLGHRDPQSTVHYVKVTPTRLAKAYADAGYFARNVRAVEVLIDQEVIESGAATKGEP